MKLRIFALVCLSAATASFGQEQTFRFEPNGIIDPGSKINVSNATTTRVGAENLINATLGPGVLRLKDFHCIIHIVRWKDNSVEVGHQNWYVYRSDSSWSDAQFTGGRIFGSRNVGFLFVHVNARGTPMSTIAARPDAAAFAAALLTLPSGRELSRSATGLAVPVWKTANDRFLTVLGTTAVESPYYTVRYKGEISAKLPSAIKDLLSLIIPGQANTAPAAVPVVPIAIWGGGMMGINPIPSDIKVTGTVEPGPEKTTEIGSKTFDNEGRYFWDISAGIPLRSIKELSFDAAGQSFAPKEISRQSLFAMFNVFPIKVDTKADRVGIVPVILVGIGISERPLDRLVFAGGLGINKIQFFAGTAYTNKQFPGATPGSVTLARRTNMIFGLNIPIRQAVAFLKAKK